ncbi:hypothetical protein F5Y13DRAFT_205734 [Hypoxylon sp. FL1857]|nr:hypothetical protein F5Y13DRAFT_205734 [Hypoxylon sp. FL1857]
MSATLPTASGHPGPLPSSVLPPTPTANEFTPVDTEINDDVHDASFITHAIPDISRNSGVVGLCTVPAKRAGMNDLGWHLADFLAWKALLCGETHPNAQTWMALCDVAGIVNTNPELYAHGKDRRLVSSAAAASSYTDSDGNVQHRKDGITVQPSAQKLKVDFVRVLSEKVKVAQAGGYPLVIIICGPTTVEQDIFFGKAEEQHHFGSDSIRHLLGEHVDAIVITPSLFSAGWQINPFFSGNPAGKVVADRTEFLAKQFGGVFAKEHIQHLLGWKSPFLDWDSVDKNEITGTFPGPPMPNAKQEQMFDELQVKIHSALAGRFSTGHGDHSFDFEAENDDWEKLIGPRRHKPLSYYHQKWAALGTGTTAATDLNRLDFLGNSFGGSWMSQVYHIKQLIKQSFVGWPGYWRLLIGQNVKKVLREFLEHLAPDARLCQEMFNVMEHRATTAVLADMTVACFGLPRPYEARCKDWDEIKWTHDTPDVDQRATNQPYAELTRCIPGACVPPRINPSHLNPMQTALQVPATYLSVALCLRYLTSSAGLEAAKRTSQFFEGIKLRQTQLLLRDSEVRDACTAWLRSINMPIRTLEDALAIVKQAEIPPVDAPGQQPGEASISTLQDSQSRRANAFNDDHFPAELKALVPVMNQEFVIQEVTKMKEDLIEQLVKASVGELLGELGAIQLKLAMVQSCLDMVRKAQRSKENGEKDEEQQTPKPITAQEPAMTAKDGTTPKPAGYVPPHLQHTVKKPVELTGEGEPNAGSFRLSSTPTRLAPAQSTEKKASPFTLQSLQKDTKENKSTEKYIPPPSSPLALVKGHEQWKGCLRGISCSVWNHHVFADTRLD